MVMLWDIVFKMNDLLPPAATKLSNSLYVIVYLIAGAITNPRQTYNRHNKL